MTETCGKIPLLYLSEYVELVRLSDSNRDYSDHLKMIQGKGYGNSKEEIEKYFSVHLNECPACNKEVSTEFRGNTIIEKLLNMDFPEEPELRL